jgi:hypothetical protein
MAVFEERGNPIEESDISAIEEARNFHLPTSYRNFLLQYNGGIPVPEIIDIDGLSEGPTDVQVFFGLGRSPDSSDLMWNLELIDSYSGIERMIPIACDSGGGLFCLSLRPEDFGAVFYFDINSSHRMYFVAADFDELLRDLRSDLN